MIVKHRNMKNAEKILKSIARKCSEVLQLKNCVLMFDDTKQVAQEEQFTISSARPTFATTDDAFVEIAAKLSEPAIFVTSDKELIRRLQAAGKEKVTVCKPKSWFQFLAHLIGGMDSNEMAAIDAWYAEAFVSNAIAHWQNLLTWNCLKTWTQIQRNIPPRYYMYYLCRKQELFKEQRREIFF